MCRSAECLIIYAGTGSDFRPGEPIPTSSGSGCSPRDQGLVTPLPHSGEVYRD